MKLQQAKRSSSPMKLLISGPSGSGKSFSSLQLAKGLVDIWEDICIIDTENGSADLYSHLGRYSVIRLEAPFHPNRYIEAINLAVEAGMKCIIIDSISHEWSGKGGCLELHEKATNSMKIPNSFAAWASVTPLHQSFLDAIIQCPIHVVCTARAKTDFIMIDRNGKSAPQKVGMALVTRDGFDYEMSVHLELDQQHQAHCSKDRTGLFMDKSPFVISAETGIRILRWCNSSGEDGLEGKISQCSSISELIKLYDELSHPQQEQAKMLFRKRKAELLAGKKVSNEIKQIPIHQNGHAVIL
jgi:hypothetical protein